MSIFPLFFRKVFSSRQASRSSPPAILVQPPEQLIGKIGVTITPLRFCGHIWIKGQIYEAMAKHECFIPANKPVKVVACKLYRLMVVPHYPHRFSQWREAPKLFREK